MQKLIKPLIQKNNSKIVLVVPDILPLALAHARRLKKFGA
jgi:hypothetical protein